MKKAAGFGLAVLMAVTAFGQRYVREDASAPEALVTLPDASRWQVGLAYGHVSRPVDLEGAERKLRGDVADVLLGFAPAPWLLLYGQAGASEARLAGMPGDEPGAGAGGVLGAQVNLWQVHEGVRETSWRFTIRLAGQYGYRTTEDEGDGEVRWGETLAMLPLDYHLTFARSYRNFYMAEFHSLRVYVGPAYSRLDGEWERRGVTQDFEGTQEWGVVGGADFWLLENLSFGARAEWFDGTSGQVTVRYFF